MWVTPRCGCLIFWVTAAWKVRWSHARRTGGPCCRQAATLRPRPSSAPSSLPSVWTRKSCKTFSSFATFSVASSSVCDLSPRFPFRFIQPCRSLCVAVRDSCAPVLACQGHPWPEVLDCDRFPAEEDMCLTPHAKFNHFAKGERSRFCCAELKVFLRFHSCIKGFSICYPRFAQTRLPKVSFCGRAVHHEDGPGCFLSV